MHDATSCVAQDEWRRAEIARGVGRERFARRVSQGIHRSVCADGFRVCSTRLLIGYSLDILYLLAHLLNQHLEVYGRLRAARVEGF